MEDGVKGTLLGPAAAAIAEDNRLPTAIAVRRSRVRRRRFLVHRGAVGEVAATIASTRASPRLANDF
jgi:hypothetical protein